MIYTQYFSGILNANGTLQINARQWKRVMNIVYLEGSIHSLQRIKDPKYPYKYEMVIFRYQQQLADLTGNQRPNELVKEMYLLSSG